MSDLAVDEAGRTPAPNGAPGSASDELTWEANTSLVFCRVLVLNGQVIVAMEVRSAGITAGDIAHACLAVGAVVDPIRGQLARHLTRISVPAETPLLPN
jgi:hypothetical protein